MGNGHKSRNLLIISASVQILKRDFCFFKPFKLLISSSVTRFCPFFPINNLWIENRHFYDWDYTHIISRIYAYARGRRLYARTPFLRIFAIFGTGF